MAFARFRITAALLSTRSPPDPMLLLPNALVMPSAQGKLGVRLKGKVPRVVARKEMAKTEAKVVVRAVDGKPRTLGTKYRLKEVRLEALWL